jgi:myo-inositol 2-dehydrogenase / D-chiro-inositol 1-dehydrogenase
MNSKKRFRVALIGYAWWGGVHAEIYRRNPRTELVGVCGRSKEKTEAFAKRYEVPVFQDIPSLIRKTEPDLVSVVTSPYSHVEYARQVIEHGIPCFVEKPLAADSETARAVVDFADSRGVPFIIDFNHRYSAQAQFVHNKIEEGHLGRIAFAVAQFHLWHDSRASSFDPERYVPLNQFPAHDLLISTECHMIDLLRYFLGEIISVQAELYDFRGIASYTTAALNFRHKNGSISSLLGSYDGDDAASESERLEIVGESGRALIRNMASEAEFQQKGDHVTEYWRTGVFDDDLRSFTYTVNRHLELILDALEKKGPVPTPAREGVRALEIAEAALKSHLEGRRVET